MTFNNWAFIYLELGTEDPAVDRAEIERGGLRTTLVAVPEKSAAVHQYLRELLAELEQDISGVAPSTPRLPEPLSERELEVLRLVGAGKSNRQIAGELFVTAGTVKTHTKSIYRKLDAHSRTQALLRARELDLL